MTLIQSVLPTGDSGDPELLCNVKRQWYFVYGNDVFVFDGGVETSASTYIMNVT